MSAGQSASAILVGLVTTEPIRIAGLSSVFEGQSQLQPVTGTLSSLLANEALGFLLVDLNDSEGLDTLGAIRRARPDIRQIVIGPEGDDELVLDSIVAGARAYVESMAGPQMVRQAIEVVTSGSIWAPRRLLSKLIDRLLAVPEMNTANTENQLTAREREVLDLILQARSNREIANQLGIEERTVKAHVARLMRKTGSENRIELSMRALNRSFVPRESLPGKASTGH